MYVFYVIHPLSTKTFCIKTSFHTFAPPSQMAGNCHERTEHLKEGVFSIEDECCVHHQTILQRRSYICSDISQRSHSVLRQL